MKDEGREWCKCWRGTIVPPPPHSYPTHHHRLLHTNTLPLPSSYHTHYHRLLHTNTSSRHHSHHHYNLPSTSQVFPPFSLFRQDWDGYFPSLTFHLHYYLLLPLTTLPTLTMQLLVYLKIGHIWPVLILLSVVGKCGDGPSNVSASQ